MKSMFNLDNTITVVTGGVGLLGQEFIKAIVRNGGIAIISDINDIVGEKIKHNLSEELLTDNIDFVKLDITSDISINKCIDYLSNKYGKIDALVNSAYPRNKNYGRHFFDVTYDDFIENVGLNLGGYFLACQKFADYFRMQGYGNIVNISSIYGVIAPRFEIYQDTQMTMPIEYAAIKSALIHLTKYMSQYLKGFNIRINSISPGGIFDNQPDSFLKKYRSLCADKGMLDKKDISGTLLYLLSDMSKYVNGQNIIVDDGFCL